MTLPKLRLVGIKDHETSQFQQAVLEWSNRVVAAISEAAVSFATGALSAVTVSAIEWVACNRLIADRIFSPIIDTATNTDVLVYRNGALKVRVGATGVTLYDALIFGGSTGQQLLIWNSSGASPENNVTAPMGSIVAAVGPSTAYLWFKKTGAGNSGWVQVST
jgi:hypothetical protein